MRIRTKRTRFLTCRGGMRGWAGILLWLACIPWLVLLSCGDFTIFPVDPNSPGPGPTQGTCDNPFPGLTKFNAKQNEIAVDAALAYPLAAAVVPKGMTFSFTDALTKASVTASAGDLMVADWNSGELVLYDSSDGNKSHTYPTNNLAEPGGVAFYYEETSFGGVATKIQLLAYTGLDLSNSKFTLYVQDFTTPKLIKLANGTSPLGYKFTYPTAVATGASSSTRGIFVVDEGGKTPDSGGKAVVRVTLKFDGSAAPQFSTAQKIESGSYIHDVTFFSQNQTLYFSDWGPGGTDPKVYKVGSALSGASPAKSTFISGASILTQPSGLAIAFTQQKATAADLLVVSRNVNLSIQAFDASGDGKTALSKLEVYYPQYLQAVAYDCTNARIVYTRLAGTGSTGVYEVLEK